VVVRSDEPVAVEVDRTVVMLSIAQGMYFGLEGVGPRIWALLERPRSVAQLCADLMDEFEVDQESCLRDVCAFLEELTDARLVRLHDATVGPAGAAAGP
jgi:hypothetical protein